MAIWWQAQHQWATIAMTQALNHENGGLGNIGIWVIGQVIMVTLALVWVWLAGLRFLWRSRSRPTAASSPTTVTSSPSTNPCPVRSPSPSTRGSRRRSGSA